MGTNRNSDNPHFDPPHLSDSPRRESPTFPSLSESKSALRKGTTVLKKKKDKKDESHALALSEELPPPHPKLAKNTRTNTVFALFSRN